MDAISIILWLFVIILSIVIIRFLIKTALTIVAFIIVLLVGIFVFSLITGTSMSALVVEPLNEAKSTIAPIIQKPRVVLTNEVEKDINKLKESVETNSTGFFDKIKNANITEKFKGKIKSIFLEK
ncbi:hypothetical protein HYV79_03125 [Candidatus Woesearchaeota archaeon]|nr:hypothetical protein [Candidatus Woesearchaeota archaeon]